MLFADVVAVSAAIAATTKRLEKRDHLAALLARLHPDEIAIVVAYLSGNIPQGRIGIGYRTVQASITEPAAAPTLEVLTIHRQFDRLAQVSGKGAESNRVQLLRELMTQSTAAEQRFLIALIAGELRQGALEGVMIEAIAKASSQPSDAVRRAAMMAGDMAVIAKAALTEGASGLDRFQVQLLRPIQPMLAQSAEDIDEALAELHQAALEFKMDGARIQAHKSGNDVAIFSRQLNDVSAAIPEAVEALRALPVRDAILDGEVIALEPSGRPRSFQTTMRRFGRRLNVDELRHELPVTPFWFDALYLDGGSVMEAPQRTRFAELTRLVPPENLIPHTTVANLDDARRFVDTALDQGHEGVMAKSPNASYAAGARGQSWLKVKQARTLDLVILAAEWGHGRRKGFLSNLHLGARDTTNGGFAMLGKTFKGLTDQMLAWQTEELLKHEIGRDNYTVFVAPVLVAEIAFNEIQISPTYPSGLALRFARVKRYRQDKTAADADTFDTVKQMAGLN